MVTPVSPDRERLERYEPTVIEPHWQRRWDELGLHRTDLTDASRPPYYLLTMYPYPSGDLHIGHWYIVTPTDAIARFKRMTRLQRLLPHRLRRLWPAGRERRHQERHPPRRVDHAQHRAHARAVPDHGRHVRLGQRGRHLPARLLPLEPVVLPEAAQGRAGLSEDGRRRLVPQGPGRAGARAGRGSRPRLLALRHAGHQARPGAVVLPHHQVRRRAAGLHGHRLARAHPRHADQLDRPLRGRRGRLHHGAGRTPPAARSCASSPPGPTPSSAPPSWSWRRSIRWSPR